MTWLWNDLPQGIDWSMLREQKKWLEERSPEYYADGLVKLLDHLQDAAVAEGFADSITVFGDS